MTEPTPEAFARRVQLYQLASVALDTWACNGKAGRRKDDPVYQGVVQGRDVPAVYSRYSSCADRAHWKLWRLGCRAPFLNRDADDRKWKPGVNISNLWNRALGAPITRRPGAGWRPLPGDELLIWNTPSGFDAHSLSIVSYAPMGELATTANYGAAGMAATPIGGAKLSDHTLYFNGRDWLCGPATRRKVVQSVLRLADLVPLFTEAPDVSGPEYSDTWTGEVSDELAALFKT